MMAELTLQERLIEEFFNELNFGFDPHFFAARDEIRNLRAKCAELEQKVLKLESGISPARAKRSGVKAE
jgi:hypothetical protein